MATYGYTKKDLEEEYRAFYPTSTLTKHFEVSKRSSIDGMECILRKGEYAGRIEMLMYRYIGRFDRLAYKFMRFCHNEVLFPTILIYPFFNWIFQKRIKLNVQMVSSRAQDHILIIDGRRFFLVGNSEQFGHQFLDERKVLTEKTVSFTTKFKQLGQRN